MGLITFWSPNNETTDRISCLSAIASYIGLNYEISSLIGHAKLTFSELDQIFLEKKRKMGQGYPLMDIGMNALKRLAISNKLSHESIKMNSVSLESNYLDILPGTIDVSGEQADKKEDIDSIVEIVFRASKLYHAVLLDVNCNSSSLADAVLMQANAIVVVLDQDINKLNKYFMETSWSEQLEDIPKILVIQNYDTDSKYTANNIKRYFNIKQPIYTIPYNTGFRDSINDRDVMGWMKRQISISKKHTNYDFIQSLDKLSKVLLEELDVNHSLKAIERGVI